MTRTAITTLPNCGPWHGLSAAFAVPGVTTVGTGLDAGTAGTMACRGAGMTWPVDGDRAAQ